MNTEEQKGPQQPERSRKRAFSLRSQLLNNHIVNEADTFLSNPSRSTNKRSDIELSTIQSAYSPYDDFRQDIPEEIEGHVASTTTIDLNYGSSNSDSKPPKKQEQTINFVKHLINLLTGTREIPPSKGGRSIPITLDLDITSLPTIENKSGRKLLVDERTRNKPYVNNIITSSRYTLISFLPRQLIAQFSKVANCYFMCVAILQLIPSWSTTGTSTTIIPLSIFISISMLREAYDDYRRHKLDKEENNRATTVLTKSNEHNLNQLPNFGLSKSTTSFSKLRPSGQSFDLKFNDDETEEECLDPNSFQSTRLLNASNIKTKKAKWKDIKVGDVVKLNCDEWVPADILVLTSNNELGETFIETMALDGETNLKSKIPNNQIHKLANLANGLNKLSGNLTCEDPNLDLYNFEGVLNIPTFDSNEKTKFPVGLDNVIFRGSVIRNTDDVLGLVIFTGEETKIRMNSIKNPRIKAPKLQKKINYVVAFMVFVVICLACFSLMAQILNYKQYKNKYWYIEGEDAGVAATFMGFIIMYNTLIPLSLYVTMEIIKAVQMLLMQSDIDMYHSPSNTPAEARTATILEELGQVSYIFSDKTGTLTDNIMLFKKFSVCGVPWIHELGKEEVNVEEDNDLTSVFSPNVEKLGSIKTTGRPSMASLSTNKYTSSMLTVENNIKNESPDSLKSSVDFIRYIQCNPDSLFSKQATLFLLSISLCHTCLPRQKSKGDTNKNNDENDIRLSLSSIEDAELNPFDTGNNLLSNEENEEEEIEIEYQASSPDELALVQAASDMGFILFESKQKIVKLKTYPNGFDQLPTITQYEILDIVEFNSDRKRMSVVVKFPNDKIIMFCKGADNIIIDRLKDSFNVKQVQNQMSMSIGERKRAEADLILNKKSFDLSATQQPSKLSFSDSFNNRNRPSTEIIDSLLNLDEDVNDILIGSRKSIDTNQRGKYSLNDDSYIPNDSILKNDQFILERTLQHIDLFSSDGLRTLLYSFKVLDNDIYQDWQIRYSTAKASLVNRNELIKEVGEELEFGFNLLGCTAIEDKLQDGVPDAIDKLRRAGIKLWMLTGDKRETAINIGYSCKLIKDYSTVIILSNEKDDLLSMETIMNAAELELDQQSIAHCVLVIDGSTLSDIETSSTIFSLFISLGMKCDSVICCRASPSQKATMVSKVRDVNKNKVTLAIGDGANDIAMIQSADVGVGITGKEGLQAARTSDYSIAQFRYLIKLLLVHGRYNYIRTSQFVLCTFYKELLFYLSQLIYQRYTLFTGSSLYESWSLSMFNTLFTSLPVLCIGMFEKDLKPSTLIAVPELYFKGVNNESFNLIIFIYWILLATSQTVSLSFMLYNVYGFQTFIDNTTYPLGVVMFTVFIVIINTKCNLIEMHSISKISIISWFVSVVGWGLWCMLLVVLYKTKENTIFFVSNGLFDHFGRDLGFWLTIIILISVGLIIDLIFRLIKRMIIFTKSEEFQILERDNLLRKKFEINSYDELKQSWIWEHDSQLKEGNGTINNFKSILRKGTKGASKKTRDRKFTMVNPTELPPNSPSIVKLRSNDYWDEEMLPSGKIIKVIKNSNKERKSGIKKLLNRGNSSNNKYTDEDIEDIIDRRIESL